MPAKPFLRRRAFLGGALTCLAGRPAAASGRFAWPDGRRAAVSLTYDDGLDSQLDHALPQLAQTGLKATFFITREASEARLAEWQNAARQGHEIEDHTDTHPCDLRSFTPARFRRQQLDPMERFLDENFGASQGRLFAYPCGYLGLGEGSRRARLSRYGRLLASRFEAARTVDGPPNEPRQVLANRLRLSAFEPTYERDDPATAYHYVDKALRSGGWAILVFHDVLPARRAEGETSLGVHRQILHRLAGDDLWCAPMQETFRFIAAATRRA